MNNQSEGPRSNRPSALLRGSYYEVAAKDEIFSTLEAESTITQRKLWRQKIQDIIETQLYETLRAIFFSLQMLLIFTGLILVEYTWVNAFKYIQVGAFSTISLVFFIDLVLNMLAFGVAETL